MNAAGARSRRRRIGFVAAAAGLGIGVALLAGEVALRVLGSTHEPRRHFRPGIYAPDPELGWALLPDYAGVHVEYEAEVPTGTNADGFRGPTLAEAAAAPFRVLALGDSCTFGRGVADDETFPAQLQARLRTSGRDGAVVLNAGVPGYDTVQERAVWTRLAEQVEPQVVILTWLPNDLVERSVDAIPKLQIMDGHLVDDVEGYLEWRDKIDHTGIHGSALYRFYRVKSKLLQDALGQRRHEWDVSQVTPEQLAYSTTPLQALIEAVQARGARFVLALLPREEEVEDDALPLSLYDQLAAWAAPLDVEVVDMARHWRAVGHKPGRFLPRDAVHPTALGYREVVDALVETQALGPGQD